MRFLAAIILVFLFVPPWVDRPIMELVPPSAVIGVTPVPLDPADRARRRVGALTYLGGIQLSGGPVIIGGYSALSIDQGRFRLLSDSGYLLQFRVDRGLHLHDARMGELGTPFGSWVKGSRDSEALAIDSRTGRAWVGYEGMNVVRRFDMVTRRVEVEARPAAMRDWPENSGAEAMVRLEDGRFLILSEGEAFRKQRGVREALLVDRDPTVPGARFARFGYVPPAGYAVSDAALLDSRHLLVLTRAFSVWHGGFSNKLVLINRAAIRPGAVVRGRELATIARPLTHDNFEGVAVTREGGATILWLVSDDNRPTFFQRTLLLKFRLDVP